MRGLLPTVRSTPRVTPDERSAIRFAPLIIGPFPPPIYGSSVINAALKEMLAQQGSRFVEIDTAAGSIRPGFGYHLSRLRVFAKALWQSAMEPKTASPSFLIAVNGGFGLVYDIVFTAIGRLRQAPIFLYHHSARYIERKAGLAALLMRIAGRDATHICCSPRMFEQLCSVYGAVGAFLHVGNAAWVNGDKRRSNWDGDHLNLGVLSVLTVDKGLLAALETLRRLRSADVPARLWLAGATLDQKADEAIRAAEKEFGPDLVRCGTIDGTQKEEFFARLDVFLFPSLYRHETQSLVVPEALAAGVPVIAFDHRYVGENVGDAGLLIPAGANFPAMAVDWILAKTRESSLRTHARLAARRQFDHVRDAAADALRQLTKALTEGRHEDSR